MIDLESIRNNQKLWDADESAMLEIYDEFIKLQTERDRLFKAHSHEMVRADTLDVEVESLKMLLGMKLGFSKMQEDFDKRKAQEK